MNTKKKIALVVGAQGVIGRNLADHLLQLEDWDVIGISRRLSHDERITHISVDLLNDEESQATLQELKSVTHVFYAAYQERPTWAELVEPNMTMLRNVVENISAVAENLEHVSLMQGYKVYGAHFGPFKTPAKESDPPHMPPEFNVDQQTYLEEVQRGKRWFWSAIRPSVVCGFALGNPMNLAMVIAVYAAMSKELGIPLRFPGKPGAYNTLIEMTDATLLAKATVWAATEPRCRNQAFNINNGDLFRWNEMWPRIASMFEIETAPPLQMNLSTVMADKEHLWKAMIAKYGLRNTPYEQVSSWGFADFVFSWDYDFFADGSKARRFGFHEFVDTEAMFAGIFEKLKAERIIP